MSLIENKKMEFTIFFSWQSDSPKNCNWNFIENALDNAIKNKKSKSGLKLLLGLIETPKICPGARQLPKLLPRKSGSAEWLLQT